MFDDPIVFFSLKFSDIGIIKAKQCTNLLAISALALLNFTGDRPFFFKNAADIVFPMFNAGTSEYSSNVAFNFSCVIDAYCMINNLSHAYSGDYLRIAHAGLHAFNLACNAVIIQEGLDGNAHANRF